MSALPWVRFFPSDWLAGTRGMTAAEMGVYISLISMMYERGEPLVEDFPRLARLCGASNSQFRKTLDSLLEDGKLTRKDGGLWNDRVEKEQSYRSEKSEVGKRAAGQRWQKAEQKQRRDDASAMRSQCEGNANQKPEARDNPSTPNGVSPPKAGKGSRIGEFQPDEAVGVELGLSPEQSHREAEKFRDWALSAPGQKGVKQDWPATWRNWARRASEDSRNNPNQRGSHERRYPNAPAQHAFASALDRAADRRELRSAPEPDREGRVWPSDRIQDRDGSDRSREGGWSSGGSVHPLRLEDRRYG